MRFRFLDATSSTPARMFLLPGQDTSRVRGEGEAEMRYLFTDESSACATRLVTDRDIEQEIQFHRRREVTTKVRVADQVTLPAQEFSALKLLNQKLRDFWATH
jgi:hypothetical protein